MLTHNYGARFRGNQIIKFADDITVVGLISINDETVCREVKRLVDWCMDNNLVRNIDKTKKMIINFRRSQFKYTPLSIIGSTVDTIKFIGVQILDGLTWSMNTTKIVKLAQQRLQFLKQTTLPPNILTTFNRGTVESVLTYCITMWYSNCNNSLTKALERLVRGR